ncbi:hypothetical protein [Dyella sp.]|uniref:hypothetical protein n=1 Tax=Dyella sp. TaxID=1869338 RepID=UPI002D782B57|nr:hypothetical protein [Dyella sp.]HET6431422.1 hypothetical protein [Dyella sp.]
MHRIARLVAMLGLALGTLLGAGCATDQRNHALTTTLSAYASMVRWGDFASAQQFVDPAMREAHPLTPIELSRFKQYRVSEYDEGQGAVPTGENEARQLVRLSVININTQAERTLIDRQTWRYDPAAHHWWLTSGLPDLSQAR